MKTNLEAAIEALLFIYGEPMSVKKIADLLNIPSQQAQSAITSLGESLKSEQRGLTLVKQRETFQLVTKPEFSKLLEQIMKSELRETLTPAALETLSIVSYGAPMTRAEIDYIRGVNSSFILRSLSIRGLVDRELDEKRANAYIYRPSLDFLKNLGIAKAEDLPEFQKFAELAKKVKPSHETQVTKHVAPNQNTLEEPISTDAT